MLHLKIVSDYRLSYILMPTSLTGMLSLEPQVIEKATHQSQTPPVFNFPAAPHESPLRKFIALQKSALLILGPRRIPPLPCPASSTHSAISIVTALGYGMLEYTDYIEAVQKLRPDIVLGMGDVLFGHKPGFKRRDMMGDRTLAWMKGLVKGMIDEENGTPRTALFAPILPIEAEQQSYYLDALKDELSDNISGLVLYDIASIDAISPTLHHLPRLSLAPISTPHDLLNAISLGHDMFTIPFITSASDAGIALSFSFPSPTQEPSTPTALPLGIDMWSPTHSTSLSPLYPNCTCYTCTHHHRAYLQHLLNAKEMLGWVLLQLHNHHTMDEFFAGVRASIKQNSFEEDRTAFHKLYTAEMPEKTGQGPR